MDYGRKDVDQPNSVKYTSEVIRGDAETLLRFSVRVKEWADRSGVVLGEGHISVVPRFIDSSDNIIYLRAPVIQGDAAQVDDKFYFPTDPTCVNGATY